MRKTLARQHNIWRNAPYQWRFDPKAAGNLTKNYKTVSNSCQRGLKSLQCISQIKSILLFLFGK